MADENKNPQKLWKLVIIFSLINGPNDLCCRDDSEEFIQNYY